MTRSRFYTSFRTSTTVSSTGRLSRPLVWRVTIERRKTPASNTLGSPDPDRTITDYFQTDHMRLDGIYNRFYEAFKGQLWDGASADFREFSLD